MDAYLPLLAAPFIGLLLSRVVAAATPPSGDPGAAASGSPGRGRSLATLLGELRSRWRDASPFSIEAAMVGGAFAVASCAVLAAPDITIAWANCVLGWGLLALAWIDARLLRLPDIMTLPLLLAGLVAAWLLEPWLLTGRATGAIVGYLAFRLISWTYVAWRGHEGLGEGDAKLLAAAGAWVGWQDLSWVIMLAALSGIAWAGLRVLTGAKMTARSQMPFGPFLALGIWMVRLAQS